MTSVGLKGLRESVVMRIVGLALHGILPPSDGAMDVYGPAPHSIANTSFAPPLEGVR